MSCFLGGVLFFVPNFVQAAPTMLITEVMYNPQGGDENHEWLELTNMSASPIDISHVKVFESGTNHGLVLRAGSAILEPTSSAIIARDPVWFASNYPRVFGALFKASFSLSNSGEKVDLKDASNTIIDSVMYLASMGGNGDGNSLHIVSSGIVAGRPDPGLFVVTLAPTRAVSSTEKVSASAAATPPPKVVPVAISLSTEAKVDRASSTPVASVVRPATVRIPTAPPLGLGLTEILELTLLIVLGVTSVWYIKGAIAVLAPSKEDSIVPSAFDIEEI